MSDTISGIIMAGKKALGGREVWRAGSVEQDIFIINDVVLSISPEDIVVKKQSFNNEWFTLRTDHAQRIKSGHSVAEIGLNIIFKSENFGTQLIPLVAGLRASPFACVYNQYLDSQLEKFGTNTVLALSSGTFSTCGHEGKPDCIRAQLNFILFNYLPFAPNWSYKTGENHDYPGFAWDSLSWRKFYEPFLGVAPVWPRNATTKFSWLEFQLSTGKDASAYISSIGLLDSLTSNPEKYSKLALEKLSIGGTYNKNILTLLLTEAIQSGDVDRSASPGNSFEEVADQIIGPTVKSAIEKGKQMGAAEAAAYLKSQKAYLQGVTSAAKKTLSSIEEIQQAGYREFQPLKTIVAVENSINIGQLAILARNRELESSETLVVESISVTLSNILATIPLCGYRYPTCQHIGSSDMYVTMNINSREEDTALLHNMYDSIEDNALRFRQIPTKFHNLEISNDFLSIFQIDELMAESISTSTNRDQLGQHMTTLSMVVPGVGRRTTLKEPEELAQEYLQTSESINEAIWKVIDKHLVNDTQRYPKFLVKTSGLSGSNTKKAFEDLVNEAQINYNKWATSLEDHVRKLAGHAITLTPLESLWAEKYAAYLELLKNARGNNYIPGVDRIITHLERESKSASYSSINLTDLHIDDLGTDKYVAKQGELLRRIAAQYLTLPEFNGIYDQYKILGINSGLPAYPDFDRQLRSVAGLSDQIEVTDLDPDVYLWYPVYNSTDLIDPTLISNAQFISSKFHSEGPTQIKDFYVKTYRDLLTGTRVKAPYSVMASSVPDPLYNEITYPGATNQEVIKKTLLIDPSQKTHVNIPEQNTIIKSTNIIEHSTNFQKWLSGTNAGSAGKYTPPSGTPSSPPVTTDNKTTPTKGSKYKKDGIRLMGQSGKPLTTLPGFLTSVTANGKTIGVKTVLAFWPNSKGAKRPYTNGPDLMVMHSVDSKGNISKYFASPRHPGADLDAKGLTKGDSKVRSGLTPWQAVEQYSISYVGNIAYRIASAHFVIERDGSIIQCVPLNLQAWQCTGVNHRSYGIELAGPLVHGFTPQQYNSLSVLLAYLKKEIPSLSEIIGHQDIVTYKGDPGKYFNWFAISNLGWKSIHFGDKLQESGLKRKTAPPPAVATAAISSATTSSTTAFTSSPTSQSVVAFNKTLEALSKSWIRGQGQSMTRAYPTFKLYFIEDDKGERKRLAYDDFFSYNSVQSIRVVRSRKIPADLCEIYITNVSGILTNRKFMNEAKSDQPRDAAGKIVTENSSLAGTAKENPIKSLLLQEGREISLRLGYCNAPEKLTTVFNGKITSIDMTDNEDLIKIIAQSFAVELVSDIKGYEKPKSYNGAYLFGWDVWGLTDDASTARILTEVMSEPEVQHFGLWKANPSNIHRGLLTDQWKLVPSPQEDNLFPPPSSAMLSGSQIVGDLKYIIHKTTIWDIIQEMTLRHPNYIASAVPYTDENSERMTLFFGLPEQLYFARAPSLNEKMVQQQLITEAEKAKENKKLTEKHQISDPADASFVYNQKAQNTTAVQYSLQQKQIMEERLTQGVESGFIAPFRSYHLLTSSHHIISNSIRANSRDVANTISIEYPDGAGAIEDKDGQPMATEDKEMVTVKLDNSLPTEEIRTQTGYFINAHNSELARRYGLSLLMQNIKDIYKGEIVIIGNPDIKPMDTVYIYDEYTDMVGPVDVEQVVHVFDQSNGFRTEITPDMVCHVNSFSTISSQAAIGCIFEGMLRDAFAMNAQLGTQSKIGANIATSIFAPFANIVGRSFASWGGFMSEMLINYTQDAHPVIMVPLMSHGKPLTGGVPTRKLPTSLWKNVFGDWSSEYDKSYTRWYDDVTDDMVDIAKKYTGRYAVGTGY